MVLLYKSLTMKNFRSLPLSLFLILISSSVYGQIGPGAPIPTLSEWGFIVLLIGFLIVGLVFLKKPHVSPEVD